MVVMSVATVQAIAARLAGCAAFRAKRDIARIAASIDGAPSPVHRWREQDGHILVGDDTAAIPDGEGYLLFAAEGMLPELVDRDPYFAGWCSVMVNVSDVAAMGGFPVAVTDVCFHAPSAPVEHVFAGMRDACRAYGVPLVGGHTTVRPDGATMLSVAVVGRADHLMTSFGALPGDALVYAVDLRGAYRGGSPFWNATEGRTAASLRGDLGVLGTLAATGVVHACKDVSNAGVAGTLLMMLESSGAGGLLDLDRLPRPAGIDIETWLFTFPSYGFLFASRPDDTPAVQSCLRARSVACDVVGRVDASRTLRLASGGQEADLWDLAEHAFTGFRPPSTVAMSAPPLPCPR
jgi:AIR synthase-related protein